MKFHDYYLSTLSFNTMLPLSFNTIHAHEGGGGGGGRGRYSQLTINGLVYGKPFIQKSVCLSSKTDELLLSLKTKANEFSLK